MKSKVHGGKGKEHWEWGFACKCYSCYAQCVFNQVLIWSFSKTETKSGKYSFCFHFIFLTLNAWFPGFSVWLMIWRGCFPLPDRTRSPVRRGALNEARCLGGAVAERLRGTYPSACSEAPFSCPWFPLVHLVCWPISQPGICTHTVLVKLAHALSWSSPNLECPL